MSKFVYLSPGAWWFIYSINIVVGRLIKSVIDGSLLITFLAVFCNICLSLNEVEIAHGWPPLEIVGYETINDCAINAVWSSSHGRPCGLYAHHLYEQTCRLNALQLYDKLVILVVLISCSLFPLSIFWTTVGILTIVLVLMGISIFGCHSCRIKCTLTYTSNCDYVLFFDWLDMWRRFLGFLVLTSHLSLCRCLVAAWPPIAATLTRLSLGARIYGGGGVSYLGCVTRIWVNFKEITKGKWSRH